MRKNLFLLTIASALLTLSSCKKVWDYVKDHPNGTADNCRIDNITFRGVYNVNDGIIFDDTLHFSYDNRENLTKLNFASTKYYRGSLISNDSYFKYDNSNRLVAYLENYNQTGNSFFGVFWHKYEYINNNVVIDTAFVYAGGAFSGENSNLEYGQASIITRIELDALGRIIHETARTAATNELYEEKRYNYDQTGNLILPGVTYTNKNSILQTNKTLMFIYRDYSLNCQSGIATQFNSNNLPVAFNSGKLTLTKKYGYLWDNQIGDFTQIDQKNKVYYTCK